MAYVAPSVPYRPEQCQTCELYHAANEGRGRCEGFAGTGYGGVGMLAIFDGESTDPCPKFQPKAGPVELAALVERVKFMESAMDLMREGTRMSNQSKATIYYLRGLEVAEPGDCTPSGTPLTVRFEENLASFAKSGVDIDALRSLYESTPLSDKTRSRLVTERDAAREKAEARSRAWQEEQQKARQARQQELEQERRSERQCITCGENLGVLEKLLRCDTHRRCAVDR